MRLTPFKIEDWEKIDPPKLNTPFTLGVPLELSLAIAEEYPSFTVWEGDKPVAAFGGLPVAPGTWEVWIWVGEGTQILPFVRLLRRALYYAFTSLGWQRAQTTLHHRNKQSCRLARLLGFGCRESNLLERYAQGEDYFQLALFKEDLECRHMPQ